jgi:protein ImuB
MERRQSFSNELDQRERSVAGFRRAQTAGMECRRIACILVPDFPITALVRANSELRDKPFALSHGVQAGLIAVSPCARARGVRPGMTAAHARALAPDLIVAYRSPAAERSAADAFLDIAESISPVVEEGEPGTVWLDLGGLERLYEHSATSHASGPEYIISTRAHQVGLDVSVGVASSKEVAYLAARCGGIRTIKSGMEREFIDWIPLDLLGLGGGPDGDGAEFELARLGIRRLGELARLDPRAVGSRLGRRGVDLIRLARGEGSTRLAPRPRAEVFAEEVDLEYGVESLEPLGFVMRAILGRLTERLKMRGLAAGGMMLSLRLDGCRRDERRVSVAASTVEVRSLLALLNLSLEASPPSAAVEAVRIVIEPRLPRPAQGDMFLPPLPAPDRLQTTIARLAAMYGPERVGTLTPQNSHRPEAVKVGAFDPPPADSINESGLPPGRGVPAPPAWNAARLVLRAMRPAMEIEVMCERGAPEFVRRRNLGARVVSLAGPWRRQGEWWAEASNASSSSQAGEHPRLPGSLNAPIAFARDYYELALDDGGVYRVFCDLSSGRWFLDGIYD